MSLEPESTWIVHKTPTRTLTIQRFLGEIEARQVMCDHDRFSRLCETGCRNYGSKYSCPPFSPPFELFIGDAKTISVLCFSLELDQFAPLPTYHRIRAANSVLKSHVERELAALRGQGFKVGGSGSCRACRPCRAQSLLPCERPHRRIYSLEAMGVDVGRLVESCFGFSLQWYSPGAPPPSYSCVVGAALEQVH